MSNNYNRNSGYGVAFADQLAGIAPTSGKHLVVVPDSTDAETQKKFFNLFPNDPEAQTMFFTSIMAAVTYGNLVPGRCDVIYIMPGNYAENVVLNNDNVQLVGIQSSLFAKPNIAPTTGPAVIMSGKGQVIKNLNISSNDGSSPAVVTSKLNPTISNCFISALNSTAILVTPGQNGGSFNAVVDSCDINSSSQGIVFVNIATYQSKDVKITNCKFWGNSGSDIASSYSGTSSFVVPAVSITESLFLDLNKTVYIDLSGGTKDNGIISDNYFANKAAALASSQVVLGNDIVFAGNYDAYGVVDGHTF